MKIKSSGREIPCILENPQQRMQTQRGTYKKSSEFEATSIFYLLSTLQLMNNITSVDTIKELLDILC